MEKLKQFIGNGILNIIVIPFIRSRPLEEWQHYQDVIADLARKYPGRGGTNYVNEMLARSSKPGQPIRVVPTEVEQPKLK